MQSFAKHNIFVKHNSETETSTTQMQQKQVLWNLGKPSKIRPTVSSRQNIPAV